MGLMSSLSVPPFKILIRILGTDSPIELLSKAEPTTKSNLLLNEKQTEKWFLLTQRWYKVVEL